MMDRRQHSTMLDEGSFMGAECDTDHCLVVAKVREILAVSKEATKKVDVKRINLGS
jgi:hypothetical protein